MRITLDIPDGLAAQITAAGKEPARAALEAIAVEGYRTDQLSESEVQQILGLATRMHVHAFLKDHQTYLHYSLEDLEQDRRTVAELFSDSPLPLRRAG